MYSIGTSVSVLNRHFTKAHASNKIQTTVTTKAQSAAAVRLTTKEREKIKQECVDALCIDLADCNLLQRPSSSALCAF